MGFQESDIDPFPQSWHGREYSDSLSDLYSIRDAVLSPRWMSKVDFQDEKWESRFEDNGVNIDAMQPALYPRICHFFPGILRKRH